MKTMRAQDYFLSEKHAFSLFSARDQEMADVHAHDFYEIVLVKEGCGFHVINDRPQLIFKGDAFFVSDNDIHYYESTHHLSLINILIRREGKFQFLASVEPILTRLRQQMRRPLPLREGLYTQLITLTQSIQDKTDDEYDLLHFSATEAAILGLLSLLARGCQQRQRSMRDTDNKHRLMLAIRDNLQQTIRWEQLAEEFGVPKRTLYRYIKSLTGFTPEKFVQRYRLLKAREMLRTTDKTVAHIAAACGFSSLPRLTDAYSRFFHHPPTAERV